MKLTDWHLDPPCDEKEEAIEALFERYSADPEKIAEADEYMAGELNNFYEGIETLFANIGDHGVLPEYLDKIEKLAKIAGNARAERIYWLAERDV